MNRLNTILDEIETIKQELAQTPDSASLKNDLGVGYFLIGEYRKSLQALKEAVKLAPEHAVYHYNLANTYAELEEFDQAIHSCLQALEINPAHIGALTNLAFCYEEKGQSSKAYEVFGYIIKTAPDVPLSHFNMGNFLLRQNRHIEAVKSYEHTLLLDSDFTDAWFNISWILLQTGVLDKALEYVNKGLQTDPNNKELQKLLADIRTKAGQR